MSKIWFGSLQNRLAEKSTNPVEIKVGDCMTQLFYSDRQVFYVMSIDESDMKGIKKMTLIRPDTRCEDYYAGNWSIGSFEDTMAHPENHTTIRVKRNRRGKFTVSGLVDDNVFAYGNLGEYEDPSF